MYNAESIFGEIIDFVLASNSWVYGISGHQIKQVRDTIILFFQDSDGCISGMLTKRFHLMDKIAEKKRQYRNKCMEFDRYPQL